MIVTGSARRMSPSAAPTPPDPVVLIISSAYNSLPAPGNRVGTSDASNMPTIQATTGNSAIKTADGAHHYRLVGLQIRAPSTLLQTAVVKIGGGETTLAEFPTDVTIDRCIVRGDATTGLRRGVEIDCIRGAVIDSYIYDCKENGNDTQAVWAYSTTGPIKIVNNYLEASGENIMFGGAALPFTDVAPSDIEIRRNHLYKPLSWVGSSWTIKNLLELKAGRRVLFEGNVLENCWVGAQNGFAILVVPKDGAGGASWNSGYDITLRYNHIKNCEAGITVVGNDNSGLPAQTSRVTFEQNLVECANVNGSGDLRLHQLTQGPVDVQLINNTWVFLTGTTGNAAGFHENTPKADRTIWRNNVFAEGLYGMVGTGTVASPGDGTFSTHFQNHSYTYNVMYGTSNPGTYTGTGNQFPTAATSVFTDFAGGDYTVKAAYQNDGSDGLDPGVNVSALASAILHAEDGQWGSEHATYSDHTYTNAELPRIYINTTYSAQSGNLWTVTSSSGGSVAGTGTGNRTDCSLAYALANCEIGDTISVLYTLTITGSFTLRAI